MIWEARTKLMEYMMLVVRCFTLLNRWKHCLAIVNHTDWCGFMCCCASYDRIIDDALPPRRCYSSDSDRLPLQSHRDPQVETSSTSLEPHSQFRRRAVSKTVCDHQLQNPRNSGMRSTHTFDGSSWASRNFHAENDTLVIDEFFQIWKPKLASLTRL